MKKNLKYIWAFVALILSSVLIFFIFFFNFPSAIERYYSVFELGDSFSNQVRGSQLGEQFQSALEKEHPKYTQEEFFYENMIQPMRPITKNGPYFFTALSYNTETRTADSIVASYNSSNSSIEILLEDTFPLSQNADLEHKNHIDAGYRILGFDGDLIILTTKPIDRIGIPGCDLQPTTASVFAYNLILSQVEDYSFNDKQIHAINRYCEFQKEDIMIQLVRMTVPEGKFVVGNLESYEFPENLDMVFSFRWNWS